MNDVSVTVAVAEAMTGERGIGVWGSTIAGVATKVPALTASNDDLRTFRRCMVMTSRGAEAPQDKVTAVLHRGAPKAIL